MGAYLLYGATFAFAAAVQPGPLQAYLVSQALARGWRRTLPAALSPLLSDGPVIVIVLLVLSRVPTRFEHVLRLAGAMFLFYLAFSAFRTWRDYRGLEPSLDGSARQSLFRATVVNLLNPNPYLGWSLVLGPLLLKGWHEAPANGVALIAGFYGTMVVSLAVIIVVSAGARRLGPRIGRVLVGASALALACFGVYELWSGLGGLLAR